jgi:hypothetical protein
LEDLLEDRTFIPARARSTRGQLIVRIIVAVVATLTVGAVPALASSNAFGAGDKGVNGNSSGGGGNFGTVKLQTAGNCADVNAEFLNHGGFCGPGDITDNESLTPRHTPHLPCADIELVGIDMRDASGQYSIDSFPPTGNQNQVYLDANNNAQWKYDKAKGGEQVMDVINVQKLVANAIAAGAETHPIQGYHFKLQFVQAPQKHKTFWVHCNAPTTPPPAPDCDGDHDNSQPSDSDCQPPPPPPPAADCDGDHDNSQPSDGNCQPPTPPPPSDEGSLTGHIYDCSHGSQTTTEVSGGTIAISGPDSKPAASSPISYNHIAAGDYTATATPPGHFHMVVCGGSSSISGGTAVEGVHVPNNGTGNAVFYVAPNPGMLVGEIVNCNANGTAGGPAPTGGVIAIPGTSGASGALAPVTVTTAPGTYTVDATPPAGFNLVNCGAGGGHVTSTTAADQSAVVVADETTTAVFFVQPTPSSSTQTPPPSGGTQGANTGDTAAGQVAGVQVSGNQASRAATTHNGQVLGATTSPNTGRSDLIRTMVSVIAIVVVGAAVMASTVRRRPRLAG